MTLKQKIIAVLVIAFFSTIFVLTSLEFLFKAIFAAAGLSVICYVCDKYTDRV